MEFILYHWKKITSGLLDFTVANVAFTSFYKPYNKMVYLT